MPEQFTGGRWEEPRWHNDGMPVLRAILPTTRRSRVEFGVLLACWLIATAVLAVGAYALQYTTTITDGFAYIRIAELYAMGNWGEALNAFWSPMLSWSMLPFMGFGMSSEAAIWAASAAWSSLGILAAVLLTWRWTQRNFAASFVVGVTFTAFLVPQLMQEGPDLAVVTWTVLLLAVLAEANEVFAAGSRRTRIGWGIALGVVLALGYYIKAYNIPVFIVVGVAWVAVRLAVAVRAVPRGERVATLRRLAVLPAVATGVVLVLLAPFVTALSVKYGYVTAGTSFAVNTQSKLGASGSDDNTLLLAAPPGPNAISFGDDRTLQLAYYDQLTPPGSKGSLVHQVGYYVSQRVQGLPFYLSRVEVVAPFAVLIAVVVLLLLCFRVVDAKRHRVAVLAEAILVVYFLGYAALASASSGGGNIRYYLPLLGMSTIVAALLWPAVWRRVTALGGWWRRALVIVLALLIPLAATTQNALGFPYPFSKAGTQVSVGYLRKAPVESSAEKFAHELLADGVIPPHSKLFASNGQYVRTLYYAFYMRVQLYGRSSPRNIDDPAFQKVLADAGIDYYFLYEPGNSVGRETSTLGSVVGTYTMPYTCGTVDGASSSPCRLTIVKLALPTQ